MSNQSTALIWGAAGGIGQALTQALHAAGWSVGAITHRPAALPVAVEFSCDADAADDFAVQSAVYAASQQLAAVDLWIYAAGDIVSAPVARMESAAWERVLDANLTGAYRTIHHSLPLLAENAHIVFIGAYSERLQLPGLSAYAAAKAGLEAFAAALAKEERKRRVTVVRPGAVATPLWDKMPVRLPRSAISPAELAAKIMAAHVEGHSGVLDV
jgi:NAD(P)-dependent dehydrogenase (short-subunit alcohol dehydrogenase family)